MKIDLNDFCQSSSVSIDGEYWGKVKDKKQVIRHVVETVLETPGIDLEDFLRDIVQSLQSTSYEDLGNCEQCGDYNYITTYDV